MTTPNLFTFNEKGVNYGLHKFKDGELTLVQQHSSGDWQTVRRPTEQEVRFFQEKGKPYAHA